MEDKDIRDPDKCMPCSFMAYCDITTAALRMTLKCVFDKLKHTVLKTEEVHTKLVTSVHHTKEWNGAG